MISEREEYEFKNGGTLVLSSGEDGYTVEINLGKPVIGTYTDIRELAYDIGEYIMSKRPEIFLEDKFGSKVQQQDRELYKIAIRLRRIYPKYTWMDYLSLLHGE